MAFLVTPGADEETGTVDPGDDVVVLVQAASATVTTVTMTTVRLARRRSTWPPVRLRWRLYRRPAGKAGGRPSSERPVGGGDGDHLGGVGLEHETGRHRRLGGHGEAVEVLPLR